MDDFGVDLKEVARVIGNADVLIVRFQVVEQRLLVDFRTTSAEGPFSKAVPRVGSVEERFRELKELRPAFPLPERILSFLWPRGISALEEAGVLTTLATRLRTLGGDGAEQTCRAAYRALLEEEAAVLRAAIVGGEGFQTLWERSA